MNSPQKPVRSVSMSVEIEFLRDHLEDEFRGVDHVRIRPVAPSGTMRSVDLPQDYDPTANTLHSTRGVRVIARSREYFFPAEWAKGQMSMVYDQVTEIRRYLGDA